MLKNRMRGYSRRQELFLLVGILGVILFSVFLFFGSKDAVISTLTRKGEGHIAGSVQMGTLGIFIMLIFANFASALSTFYGAQDIPFLLATPIGRRSLLAGRGIVSAVNSSWAGLVFLIPVLLGFLSSGNPSFEGVLLTVLFVAAGGFMAAAIGVAGATLFVNLIPTSRMLDFFAVLMVLLLLGLGTASNELNVAPKVLSTQIREIGLQYSVLKGGLLNHTPNGLIASGLFAVWKGEFPLSKTIELALWCTFFGTLAMAVFDRLFFRGWNMSLATERRERTLDKPFWSFPGGLFEQQMSAIMTKELRMFLRDPSQAVQLLVILLLTFLYLFNLKYLESLKFLEDEGGQWWKGVLALANVSMGGCVAAAIATRFVFPSISLEGRAYPVLRVTPLSISKLLFAKCAAWFIPVGIINTVLLISGGLALQLSGLAIFYTAIIAISMSLGLVGLGVGLGAVYARFDWDNASSLNASFGSLLHMLLAFVLIMVTLLPTGFLFCMACVPSFAEKMGNGMIAPSTVAMSTLIVINIVVARTALNSGAERLLAIERS